MMKYRKKLHKTMQPTPFIRVCFFVVMRRTQWRLANRRKTSLEALLHGSYKPNHRFGQLLIGRVKVGTPRPRGTRVFAAPPLPTKQASRGPLSLILFDQSSYVISPHPARHKRHGRAVPKYSTVGCSVFKVHSAIYKHPSTCNCRRIF